MRRCFLVCTLLALLTACAPSSATPTPTLSPVPATALSTGSATSSPALETVSPASEIPPTLESTFTLEPTITLTQPSVPTLGEPTVMPTSIPQPSVGSSAIQFYSPGPLSKLVSKVPMYGYAIPGFNSFENVTLYGEDGRVLGSVLLQFFTAYTWAYFAWSLPFEVPAAGELGRLTMSTKDVYGRLTAVNSVHLILLSEGYSNINPPGDLRERCVIEHPKPNHTNGGGVLWVTGEMRPFNSLPLVVELIDRNGVLLASQMTPVSPSPDDSYVPFSVDLPYSIPSGAWALLSVQQADDRIDGMMYLYSQEIYLYP